MWLAEWFISLLVASQLSPCLALVCCSLEASFKATLHGPLLSPAPQTKAVRSNTCTMYTEEQESFQSGMWLGKRPVLW